MTAIPAKHRAKQLLLACCLGAAAVVAQAHPGRFDHTPPDPAKLVSRMQDSLQLSEAQAKQIKGIFEASAQQRKALEQKYKISEREAFGKELKTLREQTHAKIDGVLTEPQKKARDAQREQWKAHYKRHGKRDHHRGPDRPFRGPVEAAQPAPAQAG